MSRGPNKEKLVNQFQQALRVGVGPNTKKLIHQFLQALRVGGGKAKPFNMKY
ncbi:hypothetical protein [Staphylococcus marylandisciuri]|uniref:hypothetical protein n=1 Tax=Staphylococcus marylandisciuri TaxID=2981529 RepID=UPI0021CF38F5|nr:hypothetical protein [Staphylococcus marylandisciuri]